MTIDVVNNTGKKVESMTLPKEVFGVDVKPEVLSQALRVYIEHQHQGSKSTLSRGDVNRTKAKVWRQKGTGNARHGSKNAPIFVGGGIAFGPKPKSSGRLVLNKKFKKLALVGALSVQAKNKNIVVLDSTKGFDGKTKSAITTFEAIASFVQGNTNRVLLVLPSVDKNTILACRNLPGITVSQAKRINLYEIISNKKVVLVKDSIAVLQDTFATKKAEK